VALECCSPYTTVPSARVSRLGRHAPGGGLPGFPSHFLPQESRPPVPKVLVNRDGKQLETGDDRSSSRGLNHAFPAAKQPTGRHMIQWKRDTAIGGSTYLYHSHCHEPPIPPYKPTSEVFVPVRAEKKHVFKKKKKYLRKEIFRKQILGFFSVIFWLVTAEKFVKVITLHMKRSLTSA
jgi:hypothetical protein